MSRNKGRPIASRNIRVTPEFREKPDIEKLARVLLAIVKKQEESGQTTIGKGDSVP